MKLNKNIIKNLIVPNQLELNKNPQNSLNDLAEINSLPGYVQIDSERPLFVSQFGSNKRIRGG